MCKLKRTSGHLCMAAYPTSFCAASPCSCCCFVVAALPVLPSWLPFPRMTAWHVKTAGCTTTVNQHHVTIGNPAGQWNAEKATQLFGVELRATFLRRSSLRKPFLGNLTSPRSNQMLRNEPLRENLDFGIIQEPGDQGHRGLSRQAMSGVRLELLSWVFICISSRVIPGCLITKGLVR